MALTNPLLLFGFLLAGIPVILHLMLRARPKKLLFPALRLIQNRRRQNVQRLRLRHLLLLLLRMLVISLLVFAIARPKVPPGDYHTTFKEKMWLLGILAALTWAYRGTCFWWKRQKLAPNVLSHRRTLLRYGLSGLGVVLLLLLFVWPYGNRVAASINSPIRAQNDSPVAAVLVFDVSLSMQYQLENMTRLDVAKEISVRQLASLPAGSRAAVGDNGGDAEFRLQSIPAAQSRLASIEIRPVTRPLNDRIISALEAQMKDRSKLSKPKQGSDVEETFVREVYVFTDMAASAWRLGESPTIKRLLEELPGVNVFLIDVGVPGAQNVALTTLSLSDQTPSLGSELTVRAALESDGVPAGKRTVQLFFENDAGKLVKQGESTVNVDGRQVVQVSFLVQNLSGTARQGELRLSSSDPLSFDDVLSFSVTVQPPPKVLLISDTRGGAEMISAGLAPPELVRLGRARFQCKTISPADLAKESLASYAAIWLVNVQYPEQALWKMLDKYVRQGGGLAVVVGSRVGTDDRSHGLYLTPEAVELLPAKLASQKKVSRDDELYIDFADLTHPIMARFADWGVIELASARVYRYWKVDESKGSRVIAKFDDVKKSAALLSLSVGEGRVLLLTTGLDVQAWNDLPKSGWKYVAWLDQMVRFLAQSKTIQFNFLAGDNVSISLPEQPPVERYLLRKPSRDQIPGDVTPGEKELKLSDLNEIGNYRVISTEPKFERGLSINAAPQESRLARLAVADLDTVLMPGRYTISRTVDDLKHDAKAVRGGLEMFPFVVLVLAFIFICEQSVANRFYEPESTSSPTPSRAKVA